MYISFCAFAPPPPKKNRVVLLSFEVILIDIVYWLCLPLIRRFKKTSLLNKINYEIIIINNLLKYANIYTAYSSVFFNGIYILLNNVLYLMVPFRLVVPLCRKKLSENE